MCGFVGIARLSNDPAPESTSKFLSDASELLARRGPDDETIFDTPPLSVLFRRLSIVDVEGGRQPFHNADQSVTCWVNGEIYNHVALREALGPETAFGSTSDAAVVPFLYERYGDDFVDHLQGIFAICVWDARHNKLLLVRDRLGVKPLYYAATASGLLFGSELKALLCHPDCPRHFDLPSSAEPWASDKSPVDSYVQGISHLPAGERLIAIDGQATAPQRYWALEDKLWNPSFPATSPAEIEQQFDELLADCVEQRLMSDVPLGIALSGGTDSSLVTAIVGKVHPQLLTFNVLERSTIACGDAATACEVAKTHGAEHRGLYFDPSLFAAHFGLPTFELMIGLIESPRFDLEWFYKYKLYQCAKELNPDLKVVILGQGADEFAGGYSNEGGNQCANWSQYLDERVVPGLRSTLTDEIYGNDRFEGYVDPANYPPDCAYALSAYQQKMLRHALQLQHFNLWLEDRASAFAGVEARVPFLDHRLVELLAATPPDLHEELFWDKQIVRKALAKQFPGYPTNRPKIGFFESHEQAGIHYLIASILDRSFQAFLTKYEDDIADLFDVDRLWGEFQTHCAGRTDANIKTWELINIMALVCFQALIRDPLAFMRQAHDETPAPQVLEDPDPPALDALMQAETQPWRIEISDHTSLQLAPQVRFLTSLHATSGALEITIVREQEVAASFSAPIEFDWIPQLLIKLQSANGTVSVGELCQGLSAAIGEAHQMLSRLISMRLLQVVPS